MSTVTNPNAGVSGITATEPVAWARLDVPIRVEADGTRRVGRTRVTLDVLLGKYQLGETPESLVQAFPTLRLDEVYAVIAWYLANREEVDAYLAQRQQEGEELRRKIEAVQGSSEGLLARLRERLAERRNA